PPTCISTVFPEIESSCAISLLLIPIATQVATSISRAVRPPGEEVMRVRWRPAGAIHGWTDGAPRNRARHVSSGIVAAIASIWAFADPASNPATQESTSLHNSERPAAIRHNNTRGPTPR